MKKPLIMVLVAFMISSCSKNKENTLEHFSATIIAQGGLSRIYDIIEIDKDYISQSTVKFGQTETPAKTTKPSFASYHKLKDFAQKLRLFDQEIRKPFRFLEGVDYHIELRSETKTIRHIIGADVENKELQEFLMLIESLYE